MAKLKNWNWSRSKSRNISKSKNLTEVQSASTIAKSNFLILNAKIVFTKLKQEFIQVQIFYLFNSKYQIQIKTNVLSYTIKNVLG